MTGREMIVENFVTGDILVRWQDKDWIFRSKTDFIAFFIRCAGLEDTAVYFAVISVFCITGACAKRLSRRTLLARAGGG